MVANEGSNPNARQAQQTPPVDGRLDTWGEIAAYLKVEQRTAQRWEEIKDLPIHRLGARVYAYKPELDAWVRNQEPVDQPDG
ncbi:MAG TPA: helix-turn-helix domain-containing protein [Terriglobia bacterium]|nr:helix-turn-helix domain-containing protein [Terriglobia bacterium]